MDYNFHRMKQMWMETKRMWYTVFFYFRFEEFYLKLSIKIFSNISMKWNESNSIVDEYSNEKNFLLNDNDQKSNFVELKELEMI